MPRLLIAGDHPLFRGALRQAAGEYLQDCSVLDALVFQWKCCIALL